MVPGSTIALFQFQHIQGYSFTNGLVSVTTPFSAGMFKLSATSYNYILLLSFCCTVLLFIIFIINITATNQTVNYEKLCYNEYYLNTQDWVILDKKEADIFGQAF